MVVDAIMILATAARDELLLFAAVGLLVGGTDDLLVDIVYAFQRLYRRIAGGGVADIRVLGDLPCPTRPGTLAVLVPAWDEADVIGAMVQNCLRQWHRDDVHIFVGVYPNDLATFDAVAAVAQNGERVTIVVTPDPGPTTKADCLNALWCEVLRYEQAAGAPVKAIVLHDAEDVVHPDALRVMSVMVEHHALVQLPVLPLPSARSRWIGGHYCDEFAEAHAKAMLVRGALGAAVPSAGVGCAVARATIAAVAAARGGKPFDPDSLTEDYELGLHIGGAGGRGAVVRVRDARGELIATREYFPDTIEGAVRQKARWTVGIALAGWDRLGWGRGLAELWMRLRDRRAVLAAIVLAAAYLGLVIAAPLQIVDWVSPGVVAPIPPITAALLSLNGALLLWRLAMRMLFVGHAYDLAEAVRAVPRLVIGNIIAIMAARRAVMIYLRLWRGAPLVWDKTQHRFPGLLGEPAS